ncbi:hypothetical protein ABEB36_015368 [Hypothenemus hampei]|uniref:MADF domain-containing protein n=1 Tax=Hypothenemus hampei TaxID=57062 RepID=A0ABD1DZZ6_HYPHA
MANEMQQFIKLFSSHSVAEVQAHWRHLREKYTREKRTLNTQPSGSASKATWELMTNLSWLDHYLKKKEDFLITSRTKSTLDSQNSSSVDINDCNNQENPQETEPENIYMLESDLEDGYSFQTTIPSTESNELPLK